MGNPDERLDVSALIYVELDVTLPADADPPKIYYLNADGTLEKAGVDGTTDAGVAIQQGGTVLNTTEDVAAGPQARPSSHCNNKEGRSFSVTSPL